MRAVRRQGGYPPATVAAGLRRWANGHPSTVRAAVELLVRHGVWLREVEFLAAAVHRDPDGSYWIDWAAARTAFDDGTFATASVVERAVLDLVISLGQDRYRLARMGSGTSRRIADAVTTAAGLPPPPRRPRPSRLDPTPPSNDTLPAIAGGSEIPS